MSSGGGDYVIHFVMTRDGQAPAQGERLATLALPPEEWAALVARVGFRGIRQAIAASRLYWTRAILANGYTGYGVQVVRERGYHRTIFPSAAAAALAPATTLPAEAPQ